VVSRQNNGWLISEITIYGYTLVKPEKR